jgi:N-acetylated-alpha-linked acidic dipeptidase
MGGFSRDGAVRQREIEGRLQRIPSAEEARRHHRFFTAEPHPPGSARNLELAHHIAELWKQQGWEDVRIHRYDVLDSRPREVRVEMVAPAVFRPSLREDAYDADPDTRHPGVSSAYLGFSGSGEATAPLVYAHSGNPSDYATLRRMGIEVRGKIVIVRYSNPYSYRGFKALTAEREGAAGILIYSDPAEDGFKRGKVFPDGPWGPESHIQRGAITYDFIAPGDPLTPGWASVEGAKRIPIEEAVSVPRILAVPLSWRDARPLLENMDGPEAPEDWQGGLPIRYRLGGGRVRVHLKVEMDTAVRPIHVVEARLRGELLPDEWVVMGNHRDAWVFGGVDPSSGTAAMMEVSRALGELKRQGMPPARTIVLCSWDGEEVALTGSTEWGEQFAGELRNKAVAYVNVDSAVSGPDFRVSAVPSMAPLVEDVTRQCAAPSGKSLYEEWEASMRRKQAEMDDSGLESLAGLVDPRIGSGSDHTVFLNHLGIPTVDLSFDGPYGVYHSAYDDHYWMSRFGDPGFQYHALLARVWGVLALRLANAEIVPFDFAVYADRIGGFVDELEKATAMGARLRTGGIRRRIGELRSEAERLNAAMRAALAAEAIDAELARGVNRRLREVEAGWLHPAGIPNRPWFKHLLYAARYTYAHLELPGLTEAVEGADWDVAAAQARLLEAALERNASLLRQAREDLEGAAPAGPAPAR